ncbi:hypothetical protein CAC42_4774 [Sphaceloma murrayae]|uniref:Major facilitator superfamily (MFS) profile domain-containing protein n=1 Tax=Sphaceloma murrayae TaxID=2082308 RepID=A0A2K1QPH4_9PEZI|nr:hypothetical protein CAC42_4774 [Sphaceloma murrayae]
MGLGVVEPKQDIVQGTIQLLDDQQASSVNSSTAHLKHTPDGKIVLAPQPTDDPNDPFNRPLWHRDLSYIVVLVCTILALIHGPILAPITVNLVVEYNRSLNDIAQLTSYMLLVIGSFSYIFSVLSRKLGKRGLYLIAMVVLIASDAWAATAGTYNALLGARLVSGVGQAMFEAIGLAIIPDMYFVHERGKRIALFLFFSQSGVTLGTPIATQIAVRFGNQWLFGGLAIAEGIMIIPLFFLFPETVYPREHVDALAHQDESVTLAQTHMTDEKTISEHVEHAESGTSIGAIPPKKSYLATLSPWSGVLSKHNVLTLLWRTVALTFHPTILWCAIAGLSLSWPVGISFTMAPTLQAPPYLFSVTGVGNMFIAPWIGSTFALVFGGTLDRFVLVLSKRNRNVYEPEFRLWYTLPGVVFFTIGFLGWGWGVQDQIPWSALAVFFALIYLGALTINTALISYLLDAHRAYAVESQVILFAVKNFFPFGMGYFFVPWYMSAGPKTVFAIITGIMAAIAFTTIPVYMYGKKLRAYWMRKPYLGIESMYD